MTPRLAHRPRAPLAVASVGALADAAAPVVALAIGVVRLWGLLERSETGVDGYDLTLVLWAFAVGALVTALPRRRALPGEIALAFVAIHELGRGWIEFLRAPAPDAFAQGTAFAVAAVAGVALVLGRRARDGASAPPRASTSPHR